MVRYLAAWALYGLGHLTSRIVNIIPDEWERLGEAVADVYQVLMRWSVDVQGEGDGPWREPPHP